MKKIAISLLTLGLFVMLSVPTYAKVSDRVEKQSEKVEKESLKIETKTNAVTEKIEASKATQTKKMQALCKVVTNRIAKQVSEYEKIHTQRVNGFKALNTRIQALIAKAKAAGKDTTTLETDLKALNAAIDKANADKASYIADLKKAKGTQCGQSTADFKKLSKDAAAQLKLISADLKAVSAAAAKVEKDIKATKLEVQSVKK